MINLNTFYSYIPQKTIDTKINTKLSNQIITDVKQAPSEAIKAKFCPTFGKFKNFAKVTLLDNKTGELTTANLQREVLGDYTTLKVVKKGKELGYLDMITNSTLKNTHNGEIIKENIPEVRHLRTFEGERYKGIGTSLIIGAVKESKNNGFHGKLWLEAEKGFRSEDSPYMRNRNPIPFYFKMGFECLNEETNQEMHRILDKYGEIYLPDSLTLKLDKQNAKKLLSSYNEDLIRFN